MEAAIQKVDELEREQQELEVRQKQLWKELDTAKVILATECMKTLKGKTAAYEKKLQRIKRYVDEFGGKERNVSYAFRKVKVYLDDFHEPMQDPLDWKIAEYDLLDMDQYVEIRFDYHNESVKEFVMQWIRENLPNAEWNDDMFAMDR